MMEYVRIAVRARASGLENGASSTFISSDNPNEEEPMMLMAAAGVFAMV